MIEFTLPKISVIIPAYNRAKTIRRCLDSVLAQTIKPHEIIVLDDCSADETAHIVQGYADRGVRCIVLEKNSGAQAARNRGIREATGDWIAFQDSDDEWLPEKLEKQIKALAGAGFDPWTLVHTNAIWLNTETGVGLKVMLPVVEGDNVYPLLLTKPGPMFPTMLVSRKALEKINYLDEKVPSYQEWDTSIRLAKHCRFIYLPEPLFVYHLHKDVTISKGKMREITGYQYVIDKFKDEIINICGERVWMNHVYLQLAKCLDFKLWTEADKYFKLIESKTFNYVVLKVFRLTRTSPKPLSRFYKFYSRIIDRSNDTKNHS